MHFRIASAVTGAVVTFAVCAAIGNKISYEVALTGLLAVLTYWSKAPELSNSTSYHQLEQNEELIDGDS